MKYFRNADLTKLYGVSDKAVRNWIRASQEGRIALELVERNDKAYIADTLQNSFTLEELVLLGKKYRNRINHKVITPKEEFYSLYTPEQIIDIVNSLDTFRELPHQYRYHGAGAKYWDEYLWKLYRDGRDNTLVDTILLLDDTKAYLDRIIKGRSNVNVIDIGVGNGLAAKDFAQHLKDSKKLERYICIDTSPQLLEIAGRNLTEWLGEGLKLEKHVRDIGYTPATDISQRYPTKASEESTINIFLFLGGTITNFRNFSQPLSTIHDSMGKNDILITSLKLDGEKPRRFFDFRIATDRRASLPEHDIQALELLGIEESFYEAEQFYSKQKNCRFIQLKLKVTLSIHFKMNNFEKVIEIPKGDRILLWKIAHFDPPTLEELYIANGFEVLQSTRSRNQDYLLLTTKLRVVQHVVPT